MSSWQQHDFARKYAANAADPQKNWFEHDLNFPLLVKMLPKTAQRVLDFGCGPGEFTAELATYFETVDGCDYSEEMIALARAAYPKSKFFVWNSSLNELPATPYDAIFSKLTLQFVDDLSELANSLKPLLKDGGRFAFSVPHPISTITKVNDYWENEKYDTEIGLYGMTVTMIHRSLRDYLLPFISNDYVLEDIVEPKITQMQADKYDVPQEKLAYPRRINICFKKL